MWITGEMIFRWRTRAGLTPLSNLFKSNRYNRLEYMFEEFVLMMKR